jgi:hypothetical protein
MLVSERVAKTVTAAQHSVCLRVGVVAVVLRTPAMSRARPMAQMGVVVEEILTDRVGVVGMPHNPEQTAE